jgi:Asp-tRNA(Asn)/Glu-tRNA(Gln) amidotransferase C subunit
MERVYVSDMKKIIKWFGILKKLDLLNAEPMTETAE